MLATPLLLRHGEVLSGGRLHKDLDVLIEDGVVAQLGRGLAAASADEIDVADHIVAPGFIDLHIHGAVGANCESGDREAILRLSRLLPSYGVTSFLPTIAALPPPQLRSAVAAIASARGHEAGARILGIHLEGPFLNPAAAGAQNHASMRAPSLAELDDLQTLADGSIRLMTLAPELPESLSFLAAARLRGITVSLGHTQATADVTRQAIAVGATHVTHLFNAMRPLHQREPGPIGVALMTDEVSVELICDGHHVDPSVVALARRCKPHDKLVLVSDAVALGLGDGTYEMFGATCLVSGGAIRTGKEGRLAGSCVSLDQGVRNLLKWISTETQATVLSTASTNAAAVIGERRTGEIAVGTSADLVVLDAQLFPRLTLCGGRICFPNPGDAL